MSKDHINKEVQNRYDELMLEGKHGHYESLFKVVHEQLEAFAKAYQAQNGEAVGRLICDPMGLPVLHIPLVDWYVDLGTLEIDTLFYTHAPASQARIEQLEETNKKLLDALEFYAKKEHVNFGDDLNKNFPNVYAMKYVPISGGEYPACIENGEVARQAIAEAEEK